MSDVPSSSALLLVSHICKMREKLMDEIKCHKISGPYPEEITIINILEARKCSYVAKRTQQHYNSLFFNVMKARTTTMYSSSQGLCHSSSTFDIGKAKIAKKLVWGGGVKNLDVFYQSLERLCESAKDCFHLSPTLRSTKQLLAWKNNSLAHSSHFDKFTKSFALQH